MNYKRLLCKLAVLALGLAAVHIEANPAKASSSTFFCQLQFCSTATSEGTCGTRGADCGVCHGSDGSTGPCGIQ
jgi:hypothetical protein